VHVISPGVTSRVDMTAKSGKRVVFDLDHDSMIPYYKEFEEHVTYFQQPDISKMTMYVYVSVDPIVYLGKPFSNFDIAHVEV
jgi:hypothetical protein